MLSKFLTLFLLLSASVLTAKPLEGEFYNKHSEMQTSLAHNVLDFLDLKGNEKILDVGCGDGKITAELAAMVPNGSVVGVDISEDMVRFAKRQYGKKRNLAFKVSEAEQVAASGEYDVVICFCAMHWFRDQNQALERMMRALKPGGKLIVMAVPAESPDWQYYQATLEKTKKWQQYADKSVYRSLLSTGQYLSFLQKKGFRIQLFEDVTKYSEHPNFEDFFNYAKAWMPCYVDLPENEMDDYIRQVFLNGQDQMLISKEGFKVPYRLVTFLGVKPGQSEQLQVANK